MVHDPIKKTVNTGRPLSYKENGTMDHWFEEVKRVHYKEWECEIRTICGRGKMLKPSYFDGDFAPLDNPTIIPVMDAEWQKTCGELDNLTRTTMAQYNMDVVNLLNEAEMQVTTGMSSYSAAVCDVLDKYAAKGMIIDYPTGARRSLEAAVRCCVVTSMNQTAAQVTNKYIADGGIEYVLVSAHEGARHSDKGGLFSHDGWQGKAYKIRGSESGYPNLLESTGYDIDPSTGEGQVVNPAGLHGYNCRHSHSPWDKGLENPWLDENGKPRVDPQKSREKYEQQQIQRGMERSIRQSKRQLNMKQSELDLLPEGSIERGKAQAEYDRLAYKLRQKNMKYGEFCADHNLTQQADRVKVAGWTKAESQKANGRANSYLKSLNKSGASSGAVYNRNNDPSGEKRDEIANRMYNETRKRKKFYEVEAVAKNTGMSAEDVGNIYDHIFINEHLFENGTIHRFAPDYEMGESWRRLRNNDNIQPHDITLLKHELAEYNIMGDSLDITYESAHNAINGEFNYLKELTEYLLRQRGGE